MRIAVQIAEGPHAEEMENAVLADFKAAGHELEFASDGEDLGHLLKDGFYDGVLLLSDAGSKFAMGALKSFNPRNFRGPVVAMYKPGKLNPVYSMLAAGCVSATPIEPDMPAGTMIRVLENALHGQNGANKTLRRGILEIDFDTSKVTAADMSLHFTNQELVMLAAMMAHPERVFSKQALYDRTYGGRDKAGIKIVDVYISKLRRKLNVVSKGFGSDVIQTVWGEGYKFVTPQTLPAARQSLGLVFDHAKMQVHFGGQDLSLNIGEYMILHALRFGDAQHLNASAVLGNVRRFEPEADAGVLAAYKDSLNKKLQENAGAHFVQVVSQYGQYSLQEQVGAASMPFDTLKLGHMCVRYDEQTVQFGGEGEPVHVTGGQLLFLCAAAERHPQRFTMDQMRERLFGKPGGKSAMRTLYYSLEKQLSGGNAGISSLGRVNKKIPAQYGFLIKEPAVFYKNGQVVRFEESGALNAWQAYLEARAQTQGQVVDLAVEKGAEDRRLKIV